MYSRNNINLLPGTYIEIDVIYTFYGEFGSIVIQFTVFSLFLTRRF